MKAVAKIKGRYEGYKALERQDKITFWKEALINNALYILQSTTLAELIRIRKRKKRGCVITPVNDTPSIKY